MDSAFLFSSEQCADDPVLPCNTAVTPIFPVRAVLKPQKLTQASQKYQKLTPPNGLAESQTHEFRRIRQGFIYIFVNQTIHDKTKRTDKSNGYWLIFRYKSEDGDNNSNILSQNNGSYVLKDPKTEMFMAGQYSFRSYEWTGNGPDSPWKLKGDILPYAYVPRSTTKIEIAYSEERWPAYFFTKAESDPAFRSQLMQKVDLAKESTNVSKQLKELDQHVVDFKPNIVKEILDDSFIGPLRESQVYQDCHTGIKPDKVDAVAPCEDTKNNGRIVLIDDPMGNVLEVNQRIDYNDKQRNQLNLEYQYPLAIGRALRNIKPTLEKASDFSKWWNDDFVVSQELWEEKLILEKEYNDIAKNLYQLHTDACCLGKYSLSSQIQLAFAHINHSDTDNNLELLAYTTDLLNQAYEGVGNSTLGSKYQLKTLEGKEFAAEMGKSFKEAFSAWAKVAGGITKGVSKNMDYALKAASSFDGFLHINGPELGKLKFQYKNPEFMKVIEDLFGSGEEVTKNLTTEQVLEFTTKGHKAGASSRIKDRSLAHPDSNTGNNKAVRKAPTVEVPYVKINGEFVPSVDFQALAESQNTMRNFTGGFGLFMGAYGVFSVIDQKDQPEAQTVLGKIGQHFYANLAVNFGTFAADVYEFKALVQAGNFKTLASSNLSKQIYKKTAKYLRQPKGATAASKAGNAAKAINAQKLIKVGGKVLGVVGILFTAFTAYEGYKTDDKAKMWGSGLATLGAVLMFFGPAGIAAGVIVIIIGAAIEYFGKRSPIEDWAYKSFWGQSKYYWGEEVERVTNIKNQINVAKVLAHPDNKKFDKINNFFKKELESYEELFLQVQVKEIHNKGTRFTLFLPRYTEAGSPSLTVSVRVTYFKDYYHNDKRVLRDRKTKTLKQANYQVNDSTSIALIDIFPELAKDDIKQSEIHLVELDVDYTAPTGKKYPWNGKTIYKSQHKVTWSTHRE